VYLGVGAGDETRDVEYLADKVAHLRIFPDAEGRMNRSILDRGGRALVISQFTLYGDTRKGRRPSYNQAAPPDTAAQLYTAFVEALESLGVEVETGRFRANMRVSSVNEGPITILVDSAKAF
jgi:D-tyrosyl-tRNA(Tyr) deacylase